MSIPKSPQHPGEYIRSEILEPAGVTVTEAAQRLGVGRQALDRLLNGRGGLSAEMAVRVERAAGVAAEALLQMQLAYDLAEARRTAKSIHVQTIAPPPVRRKERSAP